MTTLPVLLIGGWASGRIGFESFIDSGITWIDPHDCVGDMTTRWSPGDEPSPDTLPAAFDAPFERISAPCVLAGWSMGGLLALRAALARPDRVAGLLLISSGARMVADTRYAGADPRALRAMRRRLLKEPEATLRDFQRGASWPTPDVDAVRRAIQAGLTVEPDRLAAGLDYLAREDLRPWLDRLDAPARILHGDADAIMPLACGQALAAALPGADLEVLPDVGHRLPDTHPSAIRNALESLIYACHAR